MKNLISKKELAERLETTISTLQIYMSRSEFSEINYIKINKHPYYEGVTQKHIKRLKELIYREKNKKCFGRLRKTEIKTS